MKLFIIILSLLFDKNESNWEINSKISSINSDSKNDLILLLAKWSSVAQWSCWEARLFLYMEPYLEKNIKNVDEFLEPELWHKFSSLITCNAAIATSHPSGFPP